MNTTVRNDGPVPPDSAGAPEVRHVSTPTPLPPRRTLAAGSNPIARALLFLEQARIELSKATWPTREQLINLTVVVLAVCIIVGVFLGAVDFVLQQLVRLVVG